MECLELKNTIHEMNSRMTGFEADRIQQETGLGLPKAKLSLFFGGSGD
jgi:hypothetical protein